MIAKFKCPKCGGSGKETKTVRHSDNANTVGDSHHGVSYYTNSCPSCHEGWVALAVPCEKREGRKICRWEKLPPINTSKQSPGSKSIPCTRTDGYRLLTEAEVGMLAIFPKADLLRGAIDVMYTDGGKPVSVVPYKEG
jgi:predicted nucleic-acid-binding Zn-ribbon protein